MREDALTLFGFADADEREVFETVQTVSGVGPRLALAMLAVHTPDGLRRAVLDEDLKALQRVPGHRPQGCAAHRARARRTGSARRAGADRSPRAAVFGGDRRDQVVEALVGLGWNARAAGDAVVDRAGGHRGARRPADEVAGVLRAALRTLGGGHG